MVPLSHPRYQRVDELRLDSLQYDTAWLEGSDPDCNHRGFSRSYISKDKSPLSTPTVDTVELVCRELGNCVETIDDRITKY